MSDVLWRTKRGIARWEEFTLSGPVAAADVALFLDRK